MDFYPLNLVLAVAVASATIFLGFLPTRNIRSEFLAREVSRAVFAWVLVAMISPSAIRHYYFLLAFLCFGSWWQLRRDHALSGKMWLSIASGLGISIGIMFILAITPRAYPPGLPQPGQGLLLASIYLGGAVIGLAYVCHVLTQGVFANSGIANGMVQRYVGLLGGLVFARAGVLLTLLYLTPGMSGRFSVKSYSLPETHRIGHFSGGEIDYIFGYSQDITLPVQTIFLLGLILIILPTLAFVAKRALRTHAKTQATLALIGIWLLGIIAETIARLLVL